MPLSASDACLRSHSPAKANSKSKNGRTSSYNKYWEEADTERGRFGSSVDDNALGSSSQPPGSPPTDGIMVAAAVAAGVRGLGKGGVHWGKHHHHHGAGSDECMSEPLIGDATAKLRHLYFQRQLMRRRLAAEHARTLAPGEASRIQQQQQQRGYGNGRGRGRGGAGGGSGGGSGGFGGGRAAISRGGSSVIGRGAGISRGGRSVIGRGAAISRGGGSAIGRGASTSGGASSAISRGAAIDGESSLLKMPRSASDMWAVAPAEVSDRGAGGGGGGVGAAGAGGPAGGRRSTYTGQGWESHTLKAQQRTEEYMQGREDLAPDMRPDVVLDKQVRVVGEREGVVVDGLRVNDERGG